MLVLEETCMEQPKEARNQLAPTEAQYSACSNLGSFALEIIDARYGTGFPEFRGGQRARLGLHNGLHARFVGSTSLKLVQLLELSPLDQIITLSAGYAHDLVQLKGCGTNELETSEWYAEHLEGTRQFSVDDVEVGRLAILGTEPVFKNGILVGQKAAEMEYPSKRHEQIALALASADLGQLYAPMGPYLAHRFYQEMVTGDVDQDPGLDDLLAFQRGQAALLDAYTYPLPEAIPLLKTHEAEVAAYNELVGTQLDNGSLESFADLLEQDLAFARAFSD